MFKTQKELINKLEELAELLEKNQTLLLEILQDLVTWSESVEGALRLEEIVRRARIACGAADGKLKGDTSASTALPSGSPTGTI